MVKTILSRMFQAQKILCRWPAWPILSLIIFTGCQMEEVNVEEPRTGTLPIQMRNFNAPLKKGGTLDGTAPDIYYFKQKEDGSYVFMLTSTNYGNFETNWATDYVVIQTDANGVIKKTEVKKLPTKDGITGTFEYVWDAPPATAVPYFRNHGYIMPINRATSGPSYVADEHGFLYYNIPKQSGCYCKNQFFNLNPETGNSEFISVGNAPVLTRSFRTSDGGFISVGWEESADFEKYSSTGSRQFKQPMPYWEERPSYDFLTDRDGDFYFVVNYNSNYSYNAYPWFNPYLGVDNRSNVPRYANLLYNSVNNAKSFFSVRLSRIYPENFGNIPIPKKIEIRFGPGKKQKAHRFINTSTPNGTRGTYQDYVEVPFEVWYDDRQVMVSFRDQHDDGSFDLFHFKYDNQLFAYDNAQSQEQIWIHDNRDYAQTPDPSIAKGTFFSTNLPSFVWPYLTEGATWDPDNLPDASLSWVSAYSRPGPQLIKVNANGSTVVKENFMLGSGGKSLKTLFKSVTFNDGFAVLINAQQVTNDPTDKHLGDFGYQPTQLAILDANFNQTKVVAVEARPEDYGHQLESNKNQIFYTRVTTKPNSTGGKNSLLISTIRNGNLIEKYLDYDIETYRITPTRQGGVALVAWVRPTDNTRDLIFNEFDENLDLVIVPK